MRIFVFENKCLNMDNDIDAENLLQQGARELSTQEIYAYGMTGYEQYVSPVNTIVNADGSVSFTTPVKEIESQNLQNTINEQQLLLDTTDWYVVRYAETGVAIPEEIIQARTQARIDISDAREQLAMITGSGSV